ncbi:MAG: gfo/Idh/MocA family oxidoreductase, partial [Saprospiraceae bacterium]
MHRREFLMQSGLTAAVGLTVPSMITGRGYNPPDKVKLGIIGVGARGFETLKLALLRSDVMIVAICDID